MNELPLSCAFLFPALRKEKNTFSPPPRAYQRRWKEASFVLLLGFILLLCNGEKFAAKERSKFHLAVRQKEPRERFAAAA